MYTSDSGFERILQEVLKQKQYLEELAADTAELRRQLADLREGRGVFLEILGQRFALVGDPVPAPFLSPPAPAEGDTSLDGENAKEITSRRPTVSTHPLPPLEVEAAQPSPVQAAAVASVPPAPAAVPSTAAPAGNFLEELLLDEFSSATTRHMAVWQDPASPPPAPPRPEPKPTLIDEQEKAALRRELMGSFLLE